MTDKFVVARNTVSGLVGTVPASYLDHPVFKDQLVLVEENAKNYVPEMYKPKTAETFVASSKAPSPKDVAKLSASDPEASVADNAESVGTDKNEEK